ncbi:MAG: WD40/YVTN/BNR-like repeat-containing protein [Planctomycetota bacterium]
MKADDRHEGNWRHAGTYPPFRIVWRADRRLRDVQAVFPHPVLARRVILVTGPGLLRSDDAGRTWKRLGATSKLGRVTDVEFDPVVTDTFYLATRAKGVWVSEDAGRTVRAIGKKQTGLATDTTVAVRLYRADRRRATLLVTHGDAAPGLSVTEDRGETWRVTAREFNVYRLLCASATSLRIYLTASKADGAEARSVYTCRSLGEPWVELARDVLVTDLCLPAHAGSPYLATADAGVHRLSPSGASPVEGAADDFRELASFGVTWNGHADSQLFYAYEPRKLGLLVATDDLQRPSSYRRGLFTGPFVREGAHVRATADGHVFLAVANGALYRGVRLGGTLRVSQLRLEPASVSVAPSTHTRAMRRVQDALPLLASARSAVGPARRIAGYLEQVEGAISSHTVHVTARITGRDAEAESVTLDASRLGGSPRSPLLDDGRHGDGAAADGTYGARIPLAPGEFPTDRHDWRRPWPGRIPLTVTATADDGSLGAAVGVLYLHRRAEPFAIPDGFHHWKPSAPGQQGLRRAEGVEEGRVPGESWTGCVVEVGPGEWKLVLGSLWHTHDCTGFHALSFWIRSDKAVPRGPEVALRDYPRYLPATETPSVAVGPVTTEWRRVVVPLSPLLARAPKFQTRLLSTIVFRGECDEPRTYYLDDPRFFPTADSLEADRRRTTHD